MREQLRSIHIKRKTEAKAKIFFDVCRLFFDPFCLSYDLFRFCFHFHLVWINPYRLCRVEWSDGARRLGCCYTCSPAHNPGTRRRCSPPPAPVCRPVTPSDTPSDWCDSTGQKVNGTVHNSNSYGLFTFTNLDSYSDPDSDPIPVVGSWDWNLNSTLLSVKRSV